MQPAESKPHIIMKPRVTNLVVKTLCKIRFDAFIFWKIAAVKAHETHLYKIRNAQFMH